MSQPPYPPHGGHPPGDEEPTQQFGAPPPERDRTREFGPPLGQPPYGQPPYAPPPYAGPPPYWQPPYGRPPSGHTGLVVALVIAGIVLLAGLGVALALVVGSRNDGFPSAAVASATPSRAGSSPGEPTAGPGSPSPSSGTGIPPATVPPDGLGNDPLFDVFAQECYDGVMGSCDALYAATQDDDTFRAYNDYADTCAGRQEGGRSTSCSDAFPGD